MEVVVAPRKFKIGVHWQLLAQLLPTTGIVRRRCIKGAQHLALTVHRGHLNFLPLKELFALFFLLRLYDGLALGHLEGLVLVLLLDNLHFFF